MAKPLSKEVFNSVLTYLNVIETLDRDFLYDIYEVVNDGIDGLINNEENKAIRFVPVNPISVILYILNEYVYSIKGLNKEQIEKLSSDENFASKLASICADKYITNEQLNFKTVKFMNKYNPPISSLELYLNFALRSLNNIKSDNPYDNLVSDMLKKAFGLGQCILNLLIDGFETEAFSTWRTLHENECILICLIKNGEPMFRSYFKHIKYALAYRGQIKSKEETDQIFAEIKEEMKKYDLKSKDMKKFIEYGYLFEVEGIKLNDDFKLNFRDGVQKLAGLGRYSKVYEMSSEISHSSPLLLFSSKEYYFTITIKHLYESFFRLEDIFDKFYKSFVSKDFYNQYLVLKSTYMQQLQYIYRTIGPINILDKAEN